MSTTAISICIEYSTMINNGKVSAIGKGNLGAQVRGITTGYGHMTMENNGTVFNKASTTMTTGAYGMTCQKVQAAKAALLITAKLPYKFRQTKLQVKMQLPPVIDAQMAKYKRCNIELGNNSARLREKYIISPETLIVPPDGKTLADSNITVKNFDAIEFRADNPNLKVSAVKNADGSYSVSLTAAK